MLTRLEVKNYKSICHATIELSPFTLLIGANGAGKSNFISLLRGISKKKARHNVLMKTDGFLHQYLYELKKHLSFSDEKQFVDIKNSAGKELVITDGMHDIFGYDSQEPCYPISELDNVIVFSIDPSSSGKSERIIHSPVVNENGSGIVQVLDSLKTGDREDLFNTIESKLIEYIPEIEKLSFIPEANTKKLQVREKYISTPITIEDLSEGTRFVLTILTILYQESPPSLICIEDIDRGFHPRLFQQMIELCNDMSRELDIQIIATTHNPYILDEFRSNESAVVIVEKKEGCTTFTTLSERLAQIEANGESDEMPLGSLWYSGLVGGVPKR